MRKPRNLEAYRPTAEVVEMLRRYADNLEQQQRPGDLTNVVIQIWHWNPEWAARRPREEGRAAPAPQGEKP